MSFDGGYIKRLLYGYLESDQGRWLEVVCVDRMEWTTLVLTVTACSFFYYTLPEVVPARNMNGELRIP